MRHLIAVALTVLVVATVHGSSRQSSEGIAPLKPTSTSLSVSVTEFTLANGQTWKVLKGHYTLNEPRENPEVKIVPGAAGRWFFRIDDDTPGARVYRID